MDREKIKNLPYRKNISCIVFKEELFLIVQLKHWTDELWKFPQGGIDEGEREEEAALRELKEELGNNKFQVLAKSSFTHLVDWDEESIRLAGCKWRGQKQQFFLVKFLGGDKDIQVNANELRTYKWVKLDDLRRHIYHNHKPFLGYADAVKKVIQEFSKHGFLKQAETSRK